MRHHEAAGGVAGARQGRRDRLVDARGRCHAHAAHDVVGELGDEIDVGAVEEAGDGGRLVAAQHELAPDAVDEHLGPAHAGHPLLEDPLAEALRAAGDQHDHPTVLDRPGDVVQSLLRLVEVDVLGAPAGRGDDHIGGLGDAQVAAPVVDLGAGTVGGEEVAGDGVPDALLLVEQDVEDERERVERAKEWFEPMMTIMATEEGKRMLFDISRRWFERLGRIYISGKIGVSHRRIAGAEYHYSGKMANGFFDWIGLYASRVWGFPDTDYQSLDEVFSSVGDAEDRIAYGNLVECCVGFCVYWFLLGIHDPLYNYFNEFHCIPELREIPEKKHVYSRMFLGGSNGIEGVEYDYIHDARYQAGNYLINRKVLKDANSWLQRHQDKGMQFELIAQDVTFPDGSIIGKVFAIKDTQRDLILSFDEVGTGISQFLPVVLWCMEPPELFAIKQPELHLHPGMQSEVGDLLLNCRRASSEPGNVIVETHSEHLLLRVLRRIRETHQGTLENEVDPVTPDDVCVLYVENLGERSIVRHMPISEDGRLIHDWPGGFFEEGLRELLM